MAINGVGPTTPNFQQVDNAAAERRLAELLTAIFGARR